MKRYKRLEEADRVSIQVLTKRGYSDAEIAREIGIHRSSVGRERKRNTADGKYYYHLAQGLADTRRRAKRRRPSKMTPEIIAFVEEKLRLGWSPQQISGWMKYRQSELPTISYERIYYHVWQDRFRGGSLYRHLRHGGRRYRRYGSRFGIPDRRKGPIPDRVDIDQRPAIVEQKSRVGDWELDTIVGSQHRGVPSAWSSADQSSCVWLWCRNRNPPPSRRPLKHRFIMTRKKFSRSDGQRLGVRKAS